MPQFTVLEGAEGGRTNPFATLVARAPFDVEAVQALAMAYEALPAEARRPLIEAIVTDAEAERVSAAPALVALLSVEPDAALATLIAERLAEADAADIRVGATSRSVVRGTVEEGVAFLVEPLYGDFVEVIELHWRDGMITDALHEPLIHAADAEERLGKLGCEDLAHGESHGLETLARVIWANRRDAGQLPEGLERFAHLFSAPTAVPRPGSAPSGG